MSAFDHKRALRALLEAHPQRAVSVVDTMIEMLPDGELDYSDTSSTALATTLLEALTDDSGDSK